MKYSDYKTKKMRKRSIPMIKTSPQRKIHQKRAACTCSSQGSDLLCAGRRHAAALPHSSLPRAKTTSFLRQRAGLPTSTDTSRCQHGPQGDRGPCVHHTQSRTASLRGKQGEPPNARATNTESHDTLTSSGKLSILQHNQAHQRKTKKHGFLSNSNR